MESAQRLEHRRAPLIEVPVLGRLRDPLLRHAQRILGCGIDGAHHAPPTRRDPRSNRLSWLLHASELRLPTELPANADRPNSDPRWLDR
jgi:hypothetical protein